MPVLYVAEIEGRPTVVFAASDHVHALGFIANRFLRSELQSLRAPDGASLLPVGANITIRAANELERAAWEADLAEGLRDQTCDSSAMKAFIEVVLTPGVCFSRYWEWPRVNVSRASPG